MRQEKVKGEIVPRMFISLCIVVGGIAAKTIRNRIGPKAKIAFPVKPKRIGGRVLFDVKELDLYLDQLPTT